MIKKKIRINYNCLFFTIPYSDAQFFLGSFQGFLHSKANPEGTSCFLKGLSLFSQTVQNWQYRPSRVTFYIL
jgi:hypothetical protein